MVIVTYFLSYLGVVGTILIGVAILIIVFQILEIAEIKVGYNNI